jgi:carbon storage regulator
MLVLQREVGERIVIAKEIIVTILGIKGRRHVRVGIEAPKDIVIDREEIPQRKKIEGPRRAR